MAREKHNRAAAPAWPGFTANIAGTRGNGGRVTLQFREVFERFVKNLDRTQNARYRLFL